MRFLYSVQYQKDRGTVLDFFQELAPSRLPARMASSSARSSQYLPEEVPSANPPPSAGVPGLSRAVPSLRASPRTVVTPTPRALSNIQRPERRPQHRLPGAPDTEAWLKFFCRGLIATLTVLTMFLGGWLLMKLMTAGRN
ncbi:unnamed protein product [Vitrella brassicaformis CCMP3155]|uniref:Uncharacterized protein n=1 Tax=Vitrella brassicaformis (strain CCMP3155) TaxID=1169540 RepID=A0A0G4EQJ9_VITBC|nr:unnamed protein product [Vitrella brassicaformis CCMP3155]|eukprot:CEL99508.1 unnamed protein product [Vitrella brassicaformis CCMP3155]